MNQGGEPGHDDYGLPRVDVQIPDDARELYRDVQAYHRELRALRRAERSRRLRAPLRRTTLIIPVIAGCLVLAMIASMVLTMFSANPYFSGITGTPTRPSAGHGGSGGAAPRSPVTGTGSAASTASGRAPGTPSQSAGVPLPGTTISVAGRPVALRRLTSTALAIIPARCRCVMLVRQLLAQARLAGVTVYLVGPRGSRAELDSMDTADSAHDAFVAIDAGNVLDATYRPVGVTVLLVDAHGSVTVTPGLRTGFQMETQLRMLKPAS